MRGKHHGLQIHGISGKRQPVVPGQLTVRWEHRDAVSIIWLSGALDQATVTLLDREFDARAIGLMGLVIDLTGLVFIDSTGLEALVGIQWRASRGDDRLSFRHGRQVDQRPVELARTVRLRSRSAAWASGVSGETSTSRSLWRALMSIISGLVIDPEAA